VFVHCTVSQRMETFLRCHQLAFEFFGGYPRELLYDNAKTVVVARPDLGGDQLAEGPSWNTKFWDFAGYHGFTPRLCRPYRARPEGKVERMIGYIRQAFFVGRPLHDLDDLNRQVQLWYATAANARVHRTTGEVPALRLQRGPLLSLMDQPPYDTSIIIPRRVSTDCLVADEGNRYSVPYHYGGCSVWLRVREEAQELEVWAGEKQIAIPPVLRGHGEQSVQTEHLQGLWRLTLRGNGQRLPAALPPPEEGGGLALHLRDLPPAPTVEVRPLAVYATLEQEVMP